MEGNPDRIIKEQLTPFAIHFQNIIKDNRRKINQSEEGILEGKVFYAYDAVNNRLIDGLMNKEVLPAVQFGELSQGYREGKIFKGNVKFTAEIYYVIDIALDGRLCRAESRCSVQNG